MISQKQQTNIRRARYTGLTLRQLESLADAGAACLAITAGVQGTVKQNQLRDARVRFLNQVIPVESYRRQVVMILNHCRWRVADIWAHSPEVKPQVASFLRKCKRNQDF